MRLDLSLYRCISSVDQLILAFYEFRLLAVKPSGNREVNIINLSQKHIHGRMCRNIEVVSETKVELINSIARNMVTVVVFTYIHRWLCHLQNLQVCQRGEDGLWQSGHIVGEAQDPVLFCFVLFCFLFLFS